MQKIKVKHESEILKAEVEVIPKAGKITYKLNFRPVIDLGENYGK